MRQPYGDVEFVSLMRSELGLPAPTHQMFPTTLYSNPSTLTPVTIRTGRNLPTRECKPGPDHTLSSQNVPKWFIKLIFTFMFSTMEDKLYDQLYSFKISVQLP